MKARVVKEQRAIFSAAPGHGIAAARTSHGALPTSSWRAIGPAPAGPPQWNALVRSGYIAVKRLTEAAGVARQFLLLDVA